MNLEIMSRKRGHSDRKPFAHSCMHVNNKISHKIWNITGLVPRKLMILWLKWALSTQERVKGTTLCHSQQGSVGLWLLKSRSPVSYKDSQGSVSLLPPSGECPEGPNTKVKTWNTARMSPMWKMYTLWVKVLPLRTTQRVYSFPPEICILSQSFSRFSLGCLVWGLDFLPNPRAQKIWKQCGPVKTVAHEPLENPMPHLCIMILIYINSIKSMCIPRGSQPSSSRPHCLPCWGGTLF